MKIMIFSGGSGTRMWPVSRITLPKQFQNLVGDDSMFTKAISLVSKGFDPKDIFVLTGKDYIDVVARQAPFLPKENIIGEPEMRDTLAAVGFACAYLAKKFPEETMAAIWGADHIVKNGDAFIKALKLAEKLAREKDVIAKVDVRPSFPSVHLGYVEIGEKIGSEEGFEIYQFKRHVEKPDEPTAKTFLDSGKYLWNTGYFVWKLEKIMSLFAKHTPEVYQSLTFIQNSLGTKSEADVTAAEYAKIPKVMVDRALFEKLTQNDQVEIVADLGWADVGAWDVLKDELAVSQGVNVIKGDHVGIDTNDCLIFGNENHKLIATIGLEGMIIVDTQDALLICPKERSQDVKKLVGELRERRKEKYL